MAIMNRYTSFLSGMRTICLLTSTAIALGMPLCGLAQHSEAASMAGVATSALPETANAESLPDAPSALADSETNHDLSSDAGDGQNNNPLKPFRVAPRLSLTIEPDYSATPLDFERSFLLAGHEVISYAFPVRVVVSAGISQGRKSDPKFGDGEDAFAQRVGAAAARQTTQSIVSDGLLAPLLRQDPRYYVLGNQYGFFHRGFYALSRVLVTRTYSGRETLNSSTLIGYGGAAAMAQFYYPQGHRDIYAMSRTYGWSLVGLGGQHEAQEFFRFLIRSQPK